MYQSQLNTPWDDSKLEPLGCMRSLVSLIMWSCGAIAVVHEDYIYYFIFPNGAELTIPEFLKFLKGNTEQEYLYRLLQALELFQMSKIIKGQRNSPTLIDPIYFGY